jgi:hypothetical protein
LNGVEAWAAGVEAKMKEALADGARLLVTPEYHSQQWLSLRRRGSRPMRKSLGWPANHLWP